MGEKPPYLIPLYSTTEGDANKIPLKIPPGDV
jgi:hypothetical protein